MKAVPIETLAGCSETRHCELPGCFHKTREGKPFCPDHVGHNPYIQELISRLEERDSEIERVRRFGQSAVDLDGMTVAELLLHLRNNGPRTIEKLTRELQLDYSVINSYVRRLERAGKVRIGKTQRNNTTISLR